MFSFETAIVNSKLYRVQFAGDRPLTIEVEVTRLAHRRETFYRTVWDGDRKLSKAMQAVIDQVRENRLKRK